MGNSVASQKVGLKLFLKEKLDSISGFNHNINAGLGGVGSIASYFIVGDFVIRHKPNIYFVECTVADIGSAMPISSIGSPIFGINKRRVATSVNIYVIHLYCSPMSLTL